MRDRVAWVLYPFLIPVGMFLALRFYNQVENAFERLYTEGVIQAPLEDYNRFLRRLHQRYNSGLLHLAALVLALIAFGYLTCYNQYDGVRAWLDLGMGFGAIYQLMMGLIAWYAAHLVLIKIVVTAWALQRVFRWEVNIQPLHPDGCSGFRLFTDIAVTIAFFAAVMGAGVVLIVLASTILYSEPPSAEPVLLAVLLETMTPVAFFTCLYRAHRVMKAAKQALLRQIHQQFRSHFLTLQGRLTQGEMANEAAEEILRLDALHAVIRRLPVWPTNTQIVMQVVASVALPLALLIAQVFLEHAISNGP